MARRAEGSPEGAAGGEHAEGGRSFRERGTERPPMSKGLKRRNRNRPQDLGHQEVISDLQGSKSGGVVKARARL